MQMNQMGRTGVEISELCLGTMTFGTQTPEDEAHAQIDMALEAGINILDTAEMYPVNPISADTQGASEAIIGTWNAANPSRRQDYILATKHSGAGLAHIRNGAPISSASIPETVEGSLRRLQTDYIDLYQLHWPNRGSYMFRQNWTYDPTTQNRADASAQIEDILEALQKQIDKGNIRHIGLSNETAWGTAQWLRCSEDKGLPRMALIQNEYSLLCRMFDTDLAELSHYEDIGLFCFSPLAAGWLSGKYQNAAVPDGSRMSLVPEMGGRKTPRTYTAVDAYLKIAQDAGIDPIHMALAFCRTRPFMSSAIFGATRLGQLEHILKSVEVNLSQDVLDAITAAHRANPMPY